MLRTRVILALLLTASIATADGFSSAVPGTVQVSAPLTGNGSGGSPVACPDASGSAGGCVGLSAQTMGSGDKTFSGKVILGGQAQTVSVSATANQQFSINNTVGGGEAVRINLATCSATWNLAGCGARMDMQGLGILTGSGGLYSIDSTTGNILLGGYVQAITTNGNLAMRANGTGSFLWQRSSGATAASLDPTGGVISVSGNNRGISTLDANSPVRIGGNATITVGNILELAPNITGSAVTAATKDGDLKAGGASLYPVPTVTNLAASAANPVAIEADTVTLVAGAGSYTFSPAFAADPKCVCEDKTAGNYPVCTHTATTLTVAGTATDAIDFICIGRK